MLVFYRNKKEKIESLEKELEKSIKFYNSGNCDDKEWWKAVIILTLDNIEYEKNPKGIFEFSSNKIKEIIESGRLNDYEITKDNRVVQCEYKEEKETIITSIYDDYESNLEESQGYQYYISRNQ